MIKVCGYDSYNQLGEKPTGENSNGFSMIKVPQELHIDPSTILSIHVYRDHGILITNNGSMQAIGFNTDGRISNSLSKEILSKFTEFSIKDDNGVARRPISAFCGISFTLYMVSKESSQDENELFFTHARINEGQPLFVNINGHNPKAIFGGFNSAAAIDDKGEIIFIYPAELVSFPTKPLESCSLPSNEKAVKISCCLGFVVALSSTGKVYESAVSMNKKLNFKLISELQDIEIIDIDGTYEHCIAVSKGGQVFCRGSNNFCQLGLDKGINSVNKFTEVKSLKKYQIVHAYAGSNHSLFQTKEGKLISCGSNTCGEILLGEESDEYDGEKPEETLIKSGASYCIAGHGITVVFIDCEPPPNIPNKRINFSTQISEEIKNDSKITETESVSKLKKKEKAKVQEKKNITFLGVDDIEKLKKVKFIGNGGQSQVFLVSNEEGKTYALKVLARINETEMDSFDLMRRFVQEFEIINLINHPNIIKTFGICFGDEKHSPSFLLEYCPFNLANIVSKMNDIERITSVFEICSAMAEIHKLNLIHRDLKPENILFDQTKHVKISDFGISKLNDDEQEQMTLGIGTLRFMAPEILNEDDHYDNKIDVYAFGIVFFFIMTKGNYPRISVGEVAAGKKAPIPDYINDFSRNLILRCWSTEPEDRPSFNEIVDEIKRNNFNIIDGIKSKIELIKQFLNIQD